MHYYFINYNLQYNEWHFTPNAKSHTNCSCFCTTPKWNGVELLLRCKKTIITIELNAQIFDFTWVNCRDFIALALKQCIIMVWRRVSSVSFWRGFSFFFVWMLENPDYCSRNLYIIIWMCITRIVYFQRVYHSRNIWIADNLLEISNWNWRRNQALFHSVRGRGELGGLKIMKLISRLLLRPKLTFVCPTFLALFSAWWKFDSFFISQWIFNEWDWHYSPV